MEMMVGASTDVSPPKVFPAEVTARPAHYMYALRDPADGAVFYIGKGQGDRAFAHGAEVRALTDAARAIETDKHRRIEAIRARGREPEITVVAHGLRTAEEAFRIEAIPIALLATSGVQAGHHSDDHWLGGAALEERYGPPRTAEELPGPTLFVNLNRQSEDDLRSNVVRRERTRGAWPMAPQTARPFRWLFGVKRGIVRSVYAIRQKDGGALRGDPA